MTHWAPLDLDLFNIKLFHYSMSWTVQANKRDKNNSSARVNQQTQGLWFQRRKKEDLGTGPSNSRLQPTGIRLACGHHRMRIQLYYHALHWKGV